MITGEWVGAMGMTEPSGGTDVLGMKTIATQERGGYVLNGRKALITNAPEADVFLVYAKLDGRITSFVVERIVPRLLHRAARPTRWACAPARWARS